MKTLAGMVPICLPTSNRDRDPGALVERQERQGVSSRLWPEADRRYLQRWLEERYRWKDFVQSEAELRIWVADQIANGMRPWFTKFAGRFGMTGWLPVVEDIYTWHAQYDSYWRARDPMATVGIVYSQQTAATYGSSAYERAEAPILGVYQALIESRTPFEMVHDRLMDSEHLAPLDTHPAQYRGSLG